MTLEQVMSHYLRECGGDLKAAYAMSCEQVRQELTTGFNRTANQSVRPIKFKGVETIESTERPSSNQGE